MTARPRLTPSRLLAIFTDEITARSGVLHDTFKDKKRLFTRSILPCAENVRISDRLQGGVALRCDENEIWLHPYVFRKVCSNGAIMSHALHSQHVTIADWHGPVEAEAAFRDAVEACCVDDAFTTAAAEFRLAANSPLDMALNLAPFLSRLRAANALDMLDGVLERFAGQGDRSRYGLVNAITSLARDTRQPERRWRLEELGGAIAAYVLVDPPSDTRGAHAAQRAAVAVG
jgi:hypothetical protein